MNSSKTAKLNLMLQVRVEVGMDLNVRKASNETLVAILDKRVELEAYNESEMLALIAEIMQRRLWIQYGATSMFDFMTRAHYHYAPVVAQRKIDAARLLQLLPEVQEYIESGEVNLTQLGMMASAMRQKIVPVKEQREILEAVKGQTVRNTQVILNEMLEIEIKTRPKVRVQRDGSVRVEVTFSKEQWEEIEHAKDLISHSVPSGDLAEVITYCARFTASKKGPSTSIKEVKVRQTSQEQTKTGATSNSSTSSASPAKPSGDSNLNFKPVGRAAHRYVFRRDYSCRFILPNGKPCDSRYQLQVDHIISRWRGGSNDVENLQLLCGLHNRYKYEMEIH